MTQPFVLEDAVEVALQLLHGQLIAIKTFPLSWHGGNLPVELVIGVVEGALKHLMQR